MAETRKRDRFFAGFGALLFLVTASALTIIIIVSSISSKHSSSSNNSAQTADTSSAVCGQDTQDEATLPVPQVYEPPEPVNSLQATDLVEGSGTPVKDGDCLVVKYYGTLAKNGQKFDENYTTNIGFEFSLGTGEVIKGWDEGLVGMKPGGTRRLVIPSALGYGNQAAGAIPANSDLVFVVKLLRVIPNAAPQQ
ncbi:MAG TPA: FKBP-type peptidyl-prolyl cis-trans isomerase [Candidatus Saccharimonadales bacterium]